MGESGGIATVEASPMTCAERHHRRWLGRRRRRPAAESITAAVTDALTVQLRRDDRHHATVAVAGQLVRRYVHLIDDALTAAFVVHRAWFVIDLRGVSQLDPTALSIVMHHADQARRRGALVTVVPPGTSDRSVA